MLDYLRKHTIVIMAAMALVFVGLMFIGGDVQGGSMAGLFKQSYVSVDGKSYGEKDYANMGRTGLQVAFTFPSTFGSLIQNLFTTEDQLRTTCFMFKTNNPEAAFLAYRGIIRREAERLGLTPSSEEVDTAICNIPEFLNEKGIFDAAKYDHFISMHGDQAKKLQEEILRGLMSDAMSMARIKDILTGGLAVEAKFAQAWAESLNQRITINTAFLDKNVFRPQTDPGEEQIKEFWDKHKENYKNEEARFFTVYTFTPDGNTKAEKPGEISSATMETMNLVENDIWGPLNAANGKNMDQTIAYALTQKPGVCKMEKKTYAAVTRNNSPQELGQTINQSASDGRSATLQDVIFALTGAAGLKADADAAAIEAARNKSGAEQISTTQVMDNGQVVLVRLEGITPVKALPYDLARNNARADLLGNMTMEAMYKTAQELTARLDREAASTEVFNSIAGKAGAKTAAYGPFVDPQGQSQNERLAAPRELANPEQVFEACMIINPGKMARPINTGDGILLVQLVKRELEDTPEFQMQASQLMVPALTGITRTLLMIDWLKACISKYKVEINPIVNQLR